MGINHSSTTYFYCDNRSAIQIAHNDVFHERTKHIKTNCHLIRHHVFSGTIHRVLVSSSDQYADIFTNAHLLFRLRTLGGKLHMADTLPS